MPVSSFSERKRLSDGSAETSMSSIMPDEFSVEQDRSSAASSLTHSDVTTNQNIKVVTRVRPLSKKELNEQSSECVDLLESNNSIVVRNGNKTFDFDAVFGPNTSQQYVYENTAGDIIRNNLFKGFNVTVLAYGQTGSGKTHTIFGGNGSTISKELNNDLDGIIPRAVHEVFKYMKELSHGYERMKVSMSFLEIYNEEARDLLSTDACPPELNIRDHNGEVFVQGLSRHSVISPAEVAALMESAAEKRSTASTLMNAVSSRSHAICTLYISIHPLPDESNDEEQVNSKLTLVDLAGSERAKKTGAEGVRLKEGININKGLFVLGQVVSALSELSHQSGVSDSNAIHVKYRDSKLTRLLQDSLGGNSKTVMVACVSPAESNVDETVNTLRYAERTRSIKNSAVRNVVVTPLTPAEAAALRRENQLLKLQLFQAQTKISSMSQMAQAITFSNISTELVHHSSFDDSFHKLKPIHVGEVMTKDELNGLDMSKLDIVTKLRLYCTSLEEKLDKIEAKSKTHADECLILSLRADKWEQRSEILMSTLKSHGLSENLDDTNEKQSKQLSLIESLRAENLDLKSQLHDVRVDVEVSRAIAAAILNGDTNIDTAEDLCMTSENFYQCNQTTKTTDSSDAISEELISMSGTIENKEAMVIQLTRERDCMEAMRSHFEFAIQSLQMEVEVLTSERRNLMEKLSKSSSTDDDPQVKRLKERTFQLELKIKDLQSKAEEHSKSLRMQNQAEKTIQKLEAEIKLDKKHRADLQKKLKESSMERRSEQLQAKNNAAKLLRDSQRLKLELSKVKDAASKQEAMLRRKAAEALAKQKLLEERNNKRCRVSGVKCSEFSLERKEQIQGWLERELNNAMVIKDLRNQVEDNTRTLEEAEEKRQMLISQKLKGEENLIRALDSEIELRKAILEQLERNLNEIYKSGDRNFALLEKSSGLFMESSFFKALSLSEMRFGMQNIFNRIISLQSENDTLKQEQKCTVENAVAVAVNDFRRVTQKDIMALKLKHSEDIAGLLESTTGAVQKQLDSKIKSFDISEEAKASLIEILGDFMSSCTSIGSQIKNELDDIKSSQESMRKFVSGVADEMISLNEAKATVKKMYKKKTSVPEPVDYMEIEEDEVEAAVEDTDDSDWSPDTPMPSKKKRKVKDETLITPLKTEEVQQIMTEGDKLERAVEDFEKMTVVELKELLRKSGLTVGGKKSELIYRLRLNVRAKEMIAASAKKKRPFPCDDNQSSSKKTKLECVTAESSLLPSEPPSSFPQSLPTRLTTATKASLLRRKSPPLSSDSITPRNSVTPRDFSGSVRPASTNFLTSSNNNSNAATKTSKRSSTRLPAEVLKENWGGKRRSNDSVESSSSLTSSCENSSTSSNLNATCSVVQKITTNPGERNTVRSARAERIRAATKALNEIRDKSKMCEDEPSISNKKPPLSLITNSAKKRKISRREDMKRSVNQALEALEALENLGPSNF